MKKLEEALSDFPQISLIGGLKPKEHVPLDLSVTNDELPPYSLAATQKYIDDIIAKLNGKAAFGGYCERRNLYRDSDIFKADDSDDLDERDIHIGVDIWIKAGTPVLAALDGTVHSFNYNSGAGNYGPTIILQHNLTGITFYTLYGHLSAESIEDIEIGDTFKAGQKIAELGEPTVNGGYPPHLHFQIIKDLEENFGDYPGVCAAADLEHYKQNCPNPNLLLKL